MMYITDIVRVLLIFPQHIAFLDISTTSYCKQPEKFCLRAFTG